MVDSLAKTDRPLDPDYYIPMVESLIIDVSMDIIVFGDSDHPSHQHRLTIDVVNEVASDCPPPPYFTEDACPPLESLIDDFADTFPLATIKPRRTANLSKPLLIEDSVWLDEPFHYLLSPSPFPTGHHAEKIPNKRAP